MDGKARGALSLFAAASLMATNGLWFKPLSGTLPLHEIVGLRFVLTFACVAALAKAFGISVRSRNLPLEALMGAVGGGLILLYFGSIAALGVALAALLLYTAPFFATFISAAFLGERPTRRHAVALAASFAGITMILKPGLSMDPRLLVGVAAGLLYGVKMVLNRALGRVDGAWAMTYYYMLVPSACFALWFAADPYSFVPPTPADAIPLAGLVAVSSVLGLLLQHYGASLVGVAEASAVLMFEAVGAALIGVLAFGEALDALTVAGGLLVVVSGAYLNLTILEN
jgi:drug/metabolite transporter (DMT)-like permease